MATRYRFGDNTKPHFITFSVVNWINVFTREGNRLVNLLVWPIFVEILTTLKTLIIYALFFVTVLTSCDKEKDIPTPVVEAIYTNDSITVKDFTKYTPTSVVRDQYHLLGYGYDVTGEYADSASARQQVFDVAKLDAAKPNTVENWKSTSSSAFNAATQDAGGLAYGISGQTTDYRFDGLDVKGQESKRYYRKEISNYFPNTDAFSSKYVYGRQSQEYVNRILFFHWSEDGYLTPSFLSDSKTLPPAELIAKYGTHVLIRINLGAKLTILYQSETQQQDKDRAAELGFSVALAKTFGAFSGYLDYLDKKSATGNFSQKISFKVTGGDVSKIKTIVDPKTGIARIDYSDWLKSINTANAELVDLQNIAPIYDFISDPLKKAEVKKYFEEYIAKNSPVVVK
jgi:hypothetical protein